MGSFVLRFGCLWLLAATLLCVASAREGGFQATDYQEEGLKGARKILPHDEGLGCSCSHLGSNAGDCPCQLDTSWLEANECPSCPVYGCGECDPLKCDECKRCCEGTVASDDRKTCNCPTCDITGCLECDAEDCSKCLVCHQGFKLGANRKCECASCDVEYCETCDPEDCHTCKVCNPFLALTSNGKSCVCPDCPINGCEVCNPEKCDECLTCVNGEIPSYPDGCVIDPHCPIPHCDVCGPGGTCKQCKYGYELTNYNTECKCSKCAVENCLECDPKDCDNCLKCKDGFDLSIPVGTDYKPAGPATCEVHDCGKKVPHCAMCDVEDPTKCVICNVGFKWNEKDKACECEHCNVPGCETCAKDDCDKCTKCGYGYELQDDCTCACATCDVYKCKKCSVYDCNVCADDCEDGYAPTGPNGECECASCSIPHCDMCSKENCTTCEKCTYGYGPSGGTDCPCELCEVPNCATCDTEDCDKCAECNPGYVLVEPGYGGEPTCVCDPDQCEIDNCKTCSVDDCHVCGECAEGLVLDGHGNCVCGECNIPGCAECCTTDCGNTCNKCTPPLQLSDDKKNCSCPKCGVDGCAVCNPEDCSKCEVCENGKVPDAYGNCGCPDCSIEHCVECSAYECGTCSECDFFYSLSYDAKACECKCDHIAGCTSCDKNCKCTACEDGLQLSECGNCLAVEESCEWKPVKSDGKSCDLVCAEHTSEHTIAVESGTLYNGGWGVTYPCFADLDECGIRAGRNSKDKYPGLCFVEFGSGPAPGFKPYKTANSSSFSCVCQTQDRPLDKQWRRREFKLTPGLAGVEEHCDVGDKECAGEGNCKDICELEHMEPVGMRSKTAYDYGETDYNVCRIGSQAYAGYNIEEETHKGFCFGPYKFNKQYDCLCAKPCTTKTKEEPADCGDGSGYGISGAYMTV